MPSYPEGCGVQYIYFLFAIGRHWRQYRSVPASTARSDTNGNPDGGHLGYPTRCG